MPFLNWISDSDLIKTTEKLIFAASSAKADALSKISKNVMDPFSAMFQMAGFGVSFDEWFISEEARQAQKTMQNFVGEFHQDILGFCKNWKNLGKGNVVDLENSHLKIIAEVKNKHNTISGGELHRLYETLESLVMPKHALYKNYTAYHVSIIPKKPFRYDIPFTPSDKANGTQKPAKTEIRTIDGASFYALATNDKNALADLFKVLPQIIQQITKNKTNSADIQKLVSLFKQAFG